MAIGSECREDKEFKFSAPTTCRNALRVKRAMQLSKPGIPSYLVLLLYGCFCLNYYFAYWWIIIKKYS